MALEDRYPQAGTTTRTVDRVDEGLRAYMLGVYNYMAAGIALTGLIAYALTMFTTTNDPALVVSTLKNGTQLTQLGHLLYQTPLKWAVMLAPLAFVIYLSVRVHKMSVGAAQTSFWLFAAVMGISLSSIFLVFTGASITQIFFVTAATFASLSVWGYVTKRDISGWGSFLFMGLVGIIIAALVNFIFLQSGALQFAISVIGVLVFAGLTAYDTQQIKDGYYEIRHDATLAAKGAVMGALSLYLDFVGMFQNLLYLFGGRE